jgi:uncharacterized protein YecE (DUF72 family)
VILIGTSGYSFPDWVGPFYPRGTESRQMLGYYVRHFPAVEVNATYYRIPPPATMASMERRTPPGFEFVVKANQEMTHMQRVEQPLYDDFLRSVEPLRAAGKLSGVLAQFPYSFRHSREGEEFLRTLRGRIPEIPLFVEFRHDSWIRDETFRFLEDTHLGYVSVDEPELPGLVPPIARATDEIGYVRFHGRNRANWWGSTRGAEAGAPGARRVREPASVRGGDRYDYLYSEGELREWVEKIRELSAKTKKTFVFFNNCHVGQAATGAKLMRRLLELPEPAGATEQQGFL